MTDPSSDEPTAPIPPAEPTGPIPPAEPTLPIPPAYPPALPAPVQQPGWGAPPPPGWGGPPSYPTPWPAYPPTAWAPGPWPPVQESNGLAITSLILGIVGVTGALCCVVFGLAGPAAIITGVAGMRKADESMGRIGGRGMAQAGMILGIVGSVFFAISIVLVIVFAVAGA